MAHIVEITYTVKLCTEINGGLDELDDVATIGVGYLKDAIKNEEDWHPDDFEVSFHDWKIIKSVLD